MKRLAFVFAALVTIFLASACQEKEDSIKALKSPVLRLSGNTVSWDSIDGAVNYLPEINGEEKTRLAELSLDLSKFGPGEYTVRIKALGDGKRHSDSEWSEALTHSIHGVLAAPVLVLNGQTVSWEAVENASSYEYTVNGGTPVSTSLRSIDFSDRTAGTYSISVRAISGNPLYSNSAWSNEVEVLVSGDLVSPELTASIAGFIESIDGAASTISWNPVQNANAYTVLIDGVAVSCEGTSVDVSSYSGTHTISVSAINTDNPAYPAGEASTLSFTIKDYGGGTEAKPYLLYDKEDWNAFANHVATSYSFTGRFLKLAADIDFGAGEAVVAGASSTKSFGGNFDGDGHSIKNFKITSSGTGAGLFSCNHGVIKNLTVQNGTISSNAATLARIAVISGGQSFGTYEGIHVKNCTVTAPDANASYGAAIIAQATSGETTISDCSIESCTLTIGKDMAGFAIGAVSTDADVRITNCSVSGGSITARIYSAGLVGISMADAARLEISNSIVKNTSVYATGSHAGGIAGLANTGLIINCISDGNTVICNSASTTGNGKFAGAVAAQTGINSSIINNLSKNCTVKSQNSVTDQLVSLLIGADIASSTGHCYNNAVLSGSIYYGANANKYVGIISGIRYTSTYYNYNFYNASLQTGANKTDPSVELRAIGKAGIAGTNDLGGTTQVADTAEGRSGLLKSLNDNITTYLEAYPLAKSWVAGSDGWPTFDFE